MPGRHFVLSCLLMLTQPAIAEIYTWTDDQGITHFADTLPAIGEPKQVTLGTSSVIPMAGNIRQREKVSVIYREIQQVLERDEPAERSGKKSEMSAAKKQCDKLQGRLKKIQQQLRAGYSTDRGNSLRRQRRELGQRYSRECILG